MATVTQDFTTDDIDYVVHDGTPLKLRLFKPAGAGPFPVIVILHGGAWNNGDYKQCDGQGEAWARAGLATASLDFRHAADLYPSSLVDTNYAVRWLKAHAGDLDLDSGRVGLSGQSSGGHLAMLAAMRPHDPRYSAIALGDGKASIDATVTCVGMQWPVINPLSRYRHAKRAIAEQASGSWAEGMPEKHDTYWGTEANMEEGNPMLALERGESLVLPPALWVQGQPDQVHDYRDLDSESGLNEPERFARNYRKAGGEIDIVYIDNSVRSSAASYDPLAAFFRKHLI
ncbi:MAG: alpha/beta hydrolase [Proteobacteria bacterium]|nr:alpha/beta hydrolase [Pseudomonadota bacterium]MDA1326482.1 alpha/beta hydrolase [Pseudomonadota bacterium]